jgi:peptide/nickel transport system substrate-binding protein
MMPKRVADTPPTKQIEDTTGCGPYRFVKAEFQPGVKAVYEKNQYYVPRSEPPSWMAGGKIAKIDRVEWIAMGDAQTAANALAKGEIDFIESPPWELLPQLAKAPGVVVKTHVVLGLTAVLRMNWLQPPLDRPKIREAVLHAVSQADYMAAVVGDPAYGKTCASFFPCGTTFGKEDASFGKADPARAKQLLKEGGYKGEKIVILQPEDIATLAAFGPVTAQALRAIGMNVDLQSQSWAKVVERRGNPRSIDQGGWHIFHTFLPNGDMLDPVTNPALSGAGRKAWFGWPTDAELEKLRDEFAQETDPAKQQALAAAIQKHAIAAVPYVPLGQALTPYAYSRPCR